MKPGLFLPDSGLGGQLPDAVHQIVGDPFGRPVPTDHLLSMLNMDGPRQPVQPHTPPIPELKGKDVRGGADLENHGILSGAMDGARRNQDMIMFFDRYFIDIFLCIKSKFSAGSLFQFPDHLPGINVVLQPQIHISFFIFCTVQDIIAFVLGVMHSEGLLNVFGQRMYLKGKISASHGIQ